jgi:hypothetical protein
MSLSDDSEDELSLPLKLLNIFKPSTVLAENLSLHVTNQIEYETIK